MVSARGCEELQHCSAKLRIESCSSSDGLSQTESVPQIVVGALLPLLTAGFDTWGFPLLPCKHTYTTRICICTAAMKGLGTVLVATTISIAGVKGDHDIDCFVGDDQGVLLYFQNQGNIEDPNFLLQTPSNVYNNMASLNQGQSVVRAY